jgi:hypothetical protein
MKEFKIEAKDSLIKIINTIILSNSKEIKLNIDANSILFRTILNLRILLKITKQAGIVLKLETTSSKGQTMISQLWKDQKEDSFSKFQESMEIVPEQKIIDKPKIKMNLPKFNFLKENSFLPITLGTLIVLFVGGYFLISSRLTANIDIKVGAERFVKSFEVKLSTISNTDIEKKILRITSSSKTFTASKEIETTGKLDAGSKAAGEIKLQNKTDKEIVLKAGTKLTLDDSKEELVYQLLEKTEVPARTMTSSSPQTYVSGEIVAKAEASNYGSSYNISAGKDLVVSGQSSSSLSAIVSSSFEGGIKKSSASVTDTDLKNVSTGSLDDFKSSYKSESSSDRVALKNSEVYTISKETFSGKLSDPQDKLKVTQEITVTSLAYDQNEALNFVKGSIKSLIPDGFELYGKDLQVEFSVLGNTDKTILNSREADSQLTVRSYKIPVFDSNIIKKDLAGKTFDEVEAYLTKLDNVINYNIELNYNIPFVSSLPKDISKINVTISRD